MKAKISRGTITPDADRRIIPFYGGREQVFEQLSQCTIAGIQLVDFSSFSQLFLKLAIDVIFTLIIIRWIFYPIYREMDYLFTTILINIVVFLICFFLINIKLKTGLAFGLFAVLSIVRYRTEQIPIRQMTYMFSVIVIAVINALSGVEFSLAELIFANLTIAFAIYVLEKNMFHKRYTVKTVKYEKIDLIKPDKQLELLNDLKERTGLNIHKAEIESINFLNNTAEINIYY